MTNLTYKLELLKAHCQYMINMLQLDQTIMHIDRATLTDLFNNVNPAQSESLEHADKQVAALRAENARLREALEKIAAGDGVYGQQAGEYKETARAALQGEQ